MSEEGMESPLPDDWSTDTIDALTVPKGVAYGVLKPGPSTPDGVPMLRVSDIREGRVDQTAIYRISRQLDEEYRRTKLAGGEVLLSIQGSVGRTAIVPQSLAGANISRTLAMIRLNDPDLGPWVQFALESPQAQAAMRQVVGGTTRDSLNLRDVRQIIIPNSTTGAAGCNSRLVESCTVRGSVCKSHLHSPTSSQTLSPSRHCCRLLWTPYLRLERIQQ